MTDPDAAREPAARSKAERDMARQMGLLNATLDAARDGVLVVDLDGHMLMANDIFARMWRIPRKIIETRDDERMLTHVCDQLTNPEGFREGVRKLYAETHTKHQDELEFVDGRTFERYTQPVIVDGAPAARIWVFRDVTAERVAEEQRVALEEQLRQSQKMEAIGKLAGGIAHDFNNLLTAILGHTQLLDNRAGDDPRQRDGLEQIRRAAQRAADLTQQLLAFSRRQMRKPRLVYLSAAIREMEKMLGPLIGEDVRLQTAYCAERTTVRVDPAQLEQVVLNLAVNARDAMRGGGTLKLETAVVDVTGAQRRWHGELQPGKHVLLTVRDSGSGMSDDTRRHAFEPFFTTKPAGEGTGLGLSTVYGIVKQSAGHVQIDSREGEGTTVRVYLPHVHDAADRDDVTVTTDTTLAGDETILVTEDEGMVRTLVKEALEMYGYRVLTASDGEEAVACSEREASRIDLLISDVIMPGINGVVLRQRLMPKRPGMKVLFMSGYAKHVVDHVGELPPDSGFLQKPFAPLDLARKVREILDR